MTIKVNALNELRKVLIRIFESDCLCGAGDPPDWHYKVKGYKVKGSEHFCHDGNCHKVLVSQLIGFKVEKV